MFGRGKAGGKSAKPEAAEKVCRCEATIAPVVLDGFACGRPDCWRTDVVKASQERFVAELLRRREAAGVVEV